MKVEMKIERVCVVVDGFIFCFNEIRFFSLKKESWCCSTRYLSRFDIVQTRATRLFVTGSDM